MTIPRITKITKAQLWSIVKNTVFACAAAYSASLQTNQDQKVAIFLAVMAGLKVVEKGFTQG